VALLRFRHPHPAECGGDPLEPFRRVQGCSTGQGGRQQKGPWLPRKRRVLILEGIAAVVSKAISQAPGWLTRAGRVSSAAVSNNFRPHAEQIVLEEDVE
jgi:hypothetical protein